MSSKKFSPIVLAVNTSRHSMSVHKKFQPICSSRLAGYMQHIYIYMMSCFYFIDNIIKLLILSFLSIKYSTRCFAQLAVAARTLLVFAKCLGQILVRFRIFLMNSFLRKVCEIRTYIFAFFAKVLVLRKPYFEVTLILIFL